jgi:membrane protease YdiL (CAAX protease family)
MNKSFFTTKLTPLITVILCIILYMSGNFQMIIAAIFVLIASAIEYKKDAFKSLGFQRKRLNIKSHLLTAPLLGIAFFLFYYYLMVPCVTYITGQPIDFSVFEPYTGNLSASLSLLVLIWLSAAFGEEIVFKGYLMRQFTKFFGSSKISLIINILIFGFIFGWIHAYQGISGQIITGMFGMLYAVIFHVRKNDLWFNIMLHGFFDTTALLFIYNGWG